ncbi:reductase [Weissella ceti]|uniref:Reductase n=1 Tax=Weissella ceti TaxID=759620 RepID=A0ABT3E3G7_9LACO|nr:reductase [Weissella ceti]MCW0952954.1 reductase [Weissella ceti]QVK11499.1 reductase [Weissella ceti]
MLNIVKKDQEKIAIGLLSYLPRFREFHRAQREFAWYESNPKDRQLLLWRNNDTNHYSAVIGVEFAYGNVVVCLLAFGAEVPHTERRERLFEILDSLQRSFHGQMILGTLRTQELITKWQREMND